MNMMMKMTKIFFFHLNKCTTIDDYHESIQPLRFKHEEKKLDFI